MLCKFCQENVRGTPCQTVSQSNKCLNNRENDWPDDDRISSSVSNSNMLMSEKSEVLSDLVHLKKIAEVVHSELSDEDKIQQILTLENFKKSKQRAIKKFKTMFPNGAVLESVEFLT